MSAAALPRDLVLEGTHLRLEPLETHHLPALVAIVSAAPEQFAFTYTPRAAKADDPYVARAFADRDRGWAFPFAMVDRRDDRVVGSTRFNEIVLDQGRIEVGFTFLDPRVHGGPLNVEAKILMFGYAFDDLRSNRVQIQADARNERSMAAIRALGACYEGTLRAHGFAADGSVRNTAMFSILRSEWPEVREVLEARLRRKSQGWG